MRMRDTDPTDLATTIRTVRDAVRRAAQRGDGAGMPALEERLDDLHQAPARGGGLQAMIEVVHAAVVASTISSLIEPVRLAAVHALHESGNITPFADDPWAPLDEHASAARTRTVHHELLRAQRSAVQACRHYERTRKTSHLRDAVKLLEAGCWAETRITGSRLTPANCDGEFARLGAALARSMPPCAWAFFSQRLRGEIAAACTASGLRTGPKLQARLHSWFAEGPWTVDLESVPIVTGAWFVTPVQQSCDVMLGRQRKSREATAAKRAEEKRRFDEWTARREADRPADISPTAAPEEQPVDEERDTGRHADGLVLVHLPDGPKWLEPAAAESCLDELERRARFKRERERRDENKREYCMKTGKPYEPPPTRYFGVD